MVKVEVGQQVIVTDGYGRVKQDGYHGAVVKVARVWIDVHKEGQNWGWRFRLDDQTDGSEFGYAARFYTLEQWAAKQLQDGAMAWLREQGIIVNYVSPWRGREIELARLIGWTPPSSPAAADQQRFAR